MNEEQIIKEKIGEGNPFRVPDHYLDHLTDSVMANVMANGKPVMDATATKTRTISVRLRRVIYAAACVAVMFVVSLAVLLGGNDNQKLADSRTKTNEPTYAETHETTVAEVADLAMMDNSDIYAYLSYDYYQE